jgi:drug/metabolite transporter (DMT)-like permease
MDSSNNFRGIIAMVAAMGIFIAAESLSKFVFATVPMFEVMFLRGLVGTLLCVIATVAMGHGKDLLQAFNPFVLARGGAEVAANTTYAWAFFYMPIADVTAVLQTAPLLVLLGAAFLYGEALRPLRLVLIAIGFIGALLVAQPGSSAASPYALLGFLVAALVAARDLMTRKVPTSIPAPVATSAVLAFLTLAAGVGMLFSEQTAVVPNMRDLSLVILAGALMAAGQLFVFIAYKIGEARAIAPFMYTLTIWAVLFGYMLFGDVPNPLAIGGMALILLAGLLVIFTDRQKAEALSKV